MKKYFDYLAKKASDIDLIKVKEKASKLSSQAKKAIDDVDLQQIKDRGRDVVEKASELSNQAKKAIDGEKIMADHNIVENVFTTKITVGVTGFSRAGKTVFIGALAQALLTADAWSQRRGQGPLAQFGPFERDQFKCARIRNDIHSHLPQFPFRQVRNSLTGHDTKWPEPTEGISRLVIDLDYSPQKHKWVKRNRHIQLELVDYPGEWLVDLPMLGQTYAEWSDLVLFQATKGLRQDWSSKYFDELKELPSSPTFDEDVTGRLSELWTEYLQQATNNGLMRNQPGRLLRPDTLRHSPILRLAPLPEQQRNNKLGTGMAKRFEEYKKKVIKPFYRDHFKNMDRQIVLMDVLRTLELGEPAFNELTETLKETLKSFHYGKGGLLSWLGRAKTSHVLFAATKADHVVRGDRANLEKMLLKMLSLLDEYNHLRSKTADHKVMALASVRATEDRMTTVSPKREILYGLPEDEKDYGAWDPGGLPLDMPPDWSAVDFRFFKFEPIPMPNALSEGFPAINLGKALNFLIKDDFK
jgi:predicted YcjX-like family ATPase